MLFSRYRVYGFLATAPLLVTLCARPVDADSSGWRVGTLSFTEVKWGKQTVVAPVTNLSDEYKFVVAQGTVTSLERPDCTPRISRRSYILEPGQTQEVAVEINVPENFTASHVAVGLYEVIDTLDDVRWGVEILNNAATAPSKAPPALLAYSDSLPRFSGFSARNAALSADLPKLLTMFFARGMTSESIANKYGLTLREVIDIGWTLHTGGFAEKRGAVFAPTVTLIEGLPFDSLNSLVTRTVRALADSVAAALPRFTAERQKWIAAKRVTADENDIMEGTALLAHAFPVVGGVVLWEELAQNYVNDSGETLNFWGQRSPCDGPMGKYGYALTDVRATDGKSFFLYESPTRRSVFGIEVPALMCLKAPISHNPTDRFQFPSGFTPSVFYHSHERTDSLIQILVAPCGDIRDIFFSQARESIVGSNKEFSPSIRLWLWNRVVTETLSQLIARGTLTNEANKYFVWIGM